MPQKGLLSGGAGVVCEVWVSPYNPTVTTYLYGQPLRIQRAVREHCCTFHGILEIAPGGKLPPYIHWKPLLLPRPEGDGSVSSPVLTPFRGLRLPFARAVRSFDVFVSRDTRPRKNKSVLVMLCPKN